MEADRTSLDVDVAEVMVEPRNVEALEVLELKVGGRRVELTEGDMLSRLSDADRRSWDVVVAEVIVEARTVDCLEVLELLELTVEECTVDLADIDPLR